MSKDIFKDMDALELKEYIADLEDEYEDLMEAKPEEDDAEDLKDWEEECKDIASLIKKAKSALASCDNVIKFKK